MVDTMPPSDLRAQAKNAEKRYRSANPISEAQLNSAREFLPGGNTRSSLYYPPFPLVMTHGDGARLTDADGNDYLDFLGEFTVAVFGHSHPVIMTALGSAMAQGLNLSSHTYGEAKLAETICRRFPTIEKVRLTNSGTEANLMALSAARVFTGREKVVLFNGAYHGGLLTMVGGASKINVPFDIVTAPYNDLAGTIGLLDGEQSEIAAVLVEPMLGAGGCIPGSSEFLVGLAGWCRENGALLIFDEVVTSRLHPNGLQAELGIRPDLTVLGKYIGGGMPFGAFGGRADVMAIFDPSTSDHQPHAGTFNNNVMTMAAGIVALDKIYTEDVARELNRRGVKLRDQLNSVCRRNGASVHFSGLGAVMQLHAQEPTVTSPDQVSNEDQDLKAVLFFGMLERGFFFARRGMISLNICLTDADLTRFVVAFEDVIQTARCVLAPRAPKGRT